VKGSSFWCTNYVLGVNEGSEKKTNMDELESWSKGFKFVARQELMVSRAEVAEHFGLGVAASGVCLLRR